MLLEAVENTMLAARDTGAYNAWREAEARCAIRLSPSPSATSIHLDVSSENPAARARSFAEALRLPAGAAQLAAILRDTDACLYIEGDSRAARVKGLDVYTTQGSGDKQSRGTLLRLSPFLWRRAAGPPLPVSTRITIR